MRVLVLDDDYSRLNIFKQKLIGVSTKTVTTAKECIEALDKDGPWSHVFLDHDLGGKVFVKSGKDTGYEVAEWLSTHPDKKPETIVIHSLNTVGAKNMQSLLPESSIIPFAWNLIKVGDREDRP